MNIEIAKKQYTLDEKIENLLDILLHIKENIDHTLSFDYECRSGICGSCAVRINGIEKLACLEEVEDNSIVEPLKNLPILRDLCVDKDNIKIKLTDAKAYLKTLSSKSISQNDVDKIDIQTKCILCNSCYSACPVYEINTNFIGPFALTRVYRYINDIKEVDIKEKLDTIQTNGIWDCTLCGSCSLVCPQNIDIKTDIINLQNISVQNGYQNPNFNLNSDFGGDDFGFEQC